MKTMRLLTLAIACAALPMLSDAAQTAPKAASNKQAASELRQNMRKLWTDHVVWTRGYIVAAVAGTPDAQAAADRLMKNQEDIGNAVAVYYGPAAGQQLTKLLKEHISIAVDLIAAAKAGNKTAQQAADGRWQQNGVEIAVFLSKANPNWPKETLVDMMKTHLSTTTAEVVARLTRDWNGDVRAFDAVYDHILMMSDAISAGIVKQFPEKFRPS
jgi:hypothetical protein